MDRFSHSQTLSNSKTAVRETVDFVNKVMLAMFFAVIALSLPITARAASDRPKNELETLIEYSNAVCDKASSSTDCADAKAAVKNRSNPSLQQNSDRDQRVCDRAIEEIEKHATTARERCSKVKAGLGLLECAQRISQCARTETELDQLFEDDEGGRDKYCNKMLANSCPAISDFNTGLDYRQERKDAEADRKEAKKLVDELVNEQNDLKKDLAKQQRELQEEQMKSAYAQREQEREIANNMKEALAGIGDNQKKAFDDIQKAYNQIDADYIGMRAQIQAAADAVAQAEEELQTQCRAAAERKYAEAEKARKAELAKRSKNVGNNVSGSTARKKAATARQRNIDYTAYLTECTAGVSAEGSSARSKIAAAQRAKASTEKLMNEKAALIEKQRAQMLKKLQDMEGDATNQQSQVIEKVNEQLTAMNEKQQLTAQINQQRIAEFQQNQSATMQSIQQKLMTANQELITTQQEASLATTRLSCLGNAAQRSESTRERFAEGFSSRASVELVVSRCEAFQVSDKCKKPAVCDSLAKYKDKVDKLPVFEVERSSGSGRTAR